MINISNQLDTIISEYSEKLNLISEENLSLKPVSAKWSKKEELRHLIDSAHNNLRRFVVAQYEMNPKIVYDQNLWNETFRYQHQSSGNLIDLWELMNEQISIVLKSMTAINSSRMCNTGKKEPELHSIEWIAEDYITHLLHHLNHILELDEFPYG